MAVLSQVSLAVIVRLSAVPAVGVVEAADRDRVAAVPEPTTMLPLVPVMLGLAWSAAASVVVSAS